MAPPFVPSPIGDAQKSLSQERDRWFESGSLQRGVCELSVPKPPSRLFRFSKPLDPISESDPQAALHDCYYLGAVWSPKSLAPDEFVIDPPPSLVLGSTLELPWLVPMWPNNATMVC